MKLVVFEDGRSDQFYPIALTRAVFELKCGITNMLTKIQKVFPSNEMRLRMLS